MNTAERKTVASVTVEIEADEKGGYVSLVYGAPASLSVAHRSFARSRPEDLLESALRKVERLLRDQLKENV